MSLWGDIKRGWGDIKSGGETAIGVVNRGFHDAWGYTKETFDRYKNDIENDLKTDLEHDALKLIQSIDHSQAGRDVVNFIERIGDDVTYARQEFWKWNSDSIGEIWNTPHTFSLKPETGTQFNGKAPEVTITPTLEISDIHFHEKLSPHIKEKFNFSDLDYAGSQKLSFDLMAAIDLQAGLKLEITTYDEGSFESPIPLQKKKSFSKKEYSEGYVAFQGGAGINGGLIVGEAATNQKYTFNLQVPIHADIKEDFWFQLKEDIDVGSIWDATKQFLKHPFSSGEAERRLIRDHNKISGSYGFALGQGQDQEKISRGDIIYTNPFAGIGTIDLEHPDSLTGLGGSFDIYPFVEIQLGFILKELGEGVDIASTNFKYSPNYRFSFPGGNAGDAGASLFEFTADTSVSLSALKTSIGPISVAGWKDNIASLQWLSAQINLQDGQGQVNFTPSLEAKPLFESL